MTFADADTDEISPSLSADEYETIIDMFAKAAIREKCVDEDGTISYVEDAARLYLDTEPSRPGEHHDPSFEEVYPVSVQAHTNHPDTAHPDSYEMTDHYRAFLSDVREMLVADIDAHIKAILAGEVEWDALEQTTETQTVTRTTHQLNE